MTGEPEWDPQYVTFASVNGIQYAYIASNNGLNGNVFKCSLYTNGTFNTCKITLPSKFWLPTSIAFTYFSGTQYAYVTDLNSGLYQCSLNPNGTLKTCKSTPLTPPGWYGLYGITFH